MEWWIALIVVVALAIAAAAAVGLFGEMTKDPVRDVYRQDLPARPLGARDLETLRFGVTLRGYAMGQVDDILDRLGAELTERDALIAELTGRDPVAELERRRHQVSVEVEAAGASLEVVPDEQPEPTAIPTTTAEGELDEQEGDQAGEPEPAVVGEPGPRA